MVFGHVHDAFEAFVGEFDFAVAGVDVVVFGADEAGGDVGGLLEGSTCSALGASPEMMRGVTDSSMRTESASSTMAKARPRMTTRSVPWP